MIKYTPFNKQFQGLRYAENGSLAITQLHRLVEEVDCGGVLRM